MLYRREGETTWKALKRNLSDALLVWDTTSVPNGTYVIKVIASDASANSPGSALVAERESDTFDIDNSPPTISIASVANVGGKTAVRFTVKDADSPVARVEYSLDAERWRPIYPMDGIADSRSEIRAGARSGADGGQAGHPAGVRRDEQRDDGAGRCAGAGRQPEVKSR